MGQLGSKIRPYTTALSTLSKHLGSRGSFRATHKLSPKILHGAEHRHCISQLHGSSWQDHDAQIFGPTLFWTFLWVCFRMRLTFKLADLD